jgi:dolichol-phosphate mannosyltransferase
LGWRYSGSDQAQGTNAYAVRTLVVIPTYNEAQTVITTISKLIELHPEVSILIVDDSSPDGTGEIVLDAFGHLPGIELLKRHTKEGLGLAYLEGFEWAFENGFERVVQMDADGSHRPSDLKLLIDSSAGADLVIGSRWIAGGAVKNWPAHRMLISRVGNQYAKFMLGTSIADMTSGYRVYRAAFLKQLVSNPVSSHGYSFQVELAYRASRSGVVVESPITFVERINGESKMTLAIVLEALTKVTLWGIRRVLT